MNKLQYEEIKKTLKEIELILKDDSLTKEQREKFENDRAGLSGALLSIWFPMSNLRRFIMLCLFFIGVFGIYSEDKNFMISFIFIIFFSPRIMGEIAFLLGRISRIFIKN